MKAAIPSCLFLAFCAVALVASVMWVLQGEESRLWAFARDTARTVTGSLSGAATTNGTQSPAPGYTEQPSSGQTNDVGKLLGGVLGKAQEVLTAKTGKPSDPSMNNVPKDPVGELFKMGQRITKTGDEMAQQILGLSDAEEIAIGREAYEITRQHQRIMVAPDLVARLDRIAAPLLQQRSRENIHFQFNVIDEPCVNAFAHLGGYIYVYRGLLEFMRSDAELEFVLGHEIGHVDLGHCKGQMTYVARAENIGGQLGANLAGLAYRALAAGHTKDHEFEADAFAYRAMRQLGRSHDEGMALLRHFAAKFPQPKTPRSSSDPMSQTMQAISRHFSTHPPIQERLQHVESSCQTSGGHVSVGGEPVAMRSGEGAPPTVCIFCRKR